MRPEAIEAMLPYLAEQYANPSGSHRAARRARRAVDEARDEIAALIGVPPGEVVFTSGGTEADNTVIVGAPTGGACCPAVEHPAVVEPIAARGGRQVAVDATGHVDLDALAGAVDASTAVVSVMTVNNEVGTITDMAAVADIVRSCAPEAVLHTDAVQAPMWVDLRTVAPLVDALSLSAHKFGGPKGVGVMTLRRGAPIRPAIIGGGQEAERRSGTHNVAGIVAMAAALRSTDAERDAAIARIGALRDRLVDQLVARIDGVHETVPRPAKAAGSAHVCIEGVESESLLFCLDEADVCASAASACASGAMERSHVLAAMDVAPDWATGALRLTLGHTTTGVDVNRGADAVVAAVDRLRSALVR